jgi:hypothetical protein
MILPKHPDLMSDEDLSEWVHRLVSLKTPESIFLDYKETISTDSRSDKREIAKDVSSFANERGGVILYGIPEDRSGDEPVPVDVGDIGMGLVSGLLEVVENILVGALSPRLPELRVREVLLPHLPDKVVYLAWHPESWEAPHMIHAYGQHRYYRRGNFQAVPMEEGEIERLYVKRQARRELAVQFLAKTDFGDSFFPPDAWSRIVVCPAFPFEDRVDFSQKNVQEWLKTNIPEGGSGWLPFVSGVRFDSNVVGVSEAYRTDTRLFRNGAASVCSSYPLEEQEMKLYGSRFLRQLERFLRLVGRFYEQIGMVGDILISVGLFNLSDVLLEPGPPRVSLPSHADLRYHSVRLEFQVQTSAVDLLTEGRRWALDSRIMDRLTQCFGVWTIPGYFRKDGSPAVRVDI